MMSFNFVPSAVETAEKCERDQIASDKRTLRAHIATLDAQILHHEEDMKRSDEELAAMATEVQVLTAQ